MVRRPLLGPRGPAVVVFFCGWELVALLVSGRVPPVTHVVRKHPWFGVVLLSLLAHHWFVEVADAPVR